MDSKSILYVLCLFILSAQTVGLKDMIYMVEKYVMHKNLKFCSFITCRSNGRFSDIEIIRKAMMNVPTTFLSIETFVSNVSTEDDYETNNMLYVLENRCDGSRNVIDKASEMEAFKKKQKWLIFKTSLHEDAYEIIKSEFGKVKLRFDSDVKVAISSTNNTNVDLYEIYNTGFGKNGSIVVDYYGFWDSVQVKLTIDGHLSRYRKKSILSGVTLRSSTVVQATKIGTIHYHLIDRKSSMDIISKFSYQIFLHFQEMHNFTSVIIARNKWFGNDIGGFEDGVAKDLHEETSDISSVAALGKIPRIAYFDFFNPMFRFSSTFIFRNRGSHNVWQNEFLKPFSTGTWMTIFLVLALLAVSLKLTNWFEMKYMGSRSCFSSFTAVLITISVICQQGSSVLPTRLGSRLIFFIILTLSFILYNYYTSSIVSALLNSKPAEPTTFRDLIKSGLELGIQAAPYTLTIFKTDMDEDIQAIRRLVFPRDERPHIWNITEGLEKIKNGPYAYHMETGQGYIEIAKSFDSQAICELSDKIGLIPSSHLAFWSKKDSQYKNLMKISLRKMAETGIIHRNRLIWEGKKPPCFANTIVLSVGLDQTFIAFFLLAIGYLLALLILFFEVWCMMKTTKNSMMK